MSECKESTITVAQLEEHAEKIRKKREEKSAQEEIVSKLSAELEELNERAVLMLQELGKTSYPAEAGRMQCREEWSVKQPETEEDREKFHGWLKEKGIYEKVLSINSQTLKALYKQELEAVKASGDPIAALDFQLPGIKEAKCFVKLSFTKK